MTMTVAVTANYALDGVAVSSSVAGNLVIDDSGVPTWTPAISTASAPVNECAITIPHVDYDAIVAAFGALPTCACAIANRGNALVEHLQVANDADPLVYFPIVGGNAGIGSTLGIYIGTRQIGTTPLSGYEIAELIGQALANDTDLSVYLAAQGWSLLTSVVGFDAQDLPPESDCPWASVDHARTIRGDNLETITHDIRLLLAVKNDYRPVTPAVVGVSGKITKYPVLQQIGKAALLAQDAIFKACQPLTYPSGITTTVVDLGQPTLTVVRPFGTATWTAQIGTAK